MDGDRDHRGIKLRRVSGENFIFKVIGEFSAEVSPSLELKSSFNTRIGESFTVGSLFDTFFFSLYTGLDLEADV
jgi:hypothetical protein